MLAWWCSYIVVLSYKLGIPKSCDPFKSSDPAGFSQAATSSPDRPWRAKKVSDFDVRPAPCRFRGGGGGRRGWWWRRLFPGWSIDGSWRVITVFLHIEGVQATRLIYFAVWKAKFGVPQGQKNTHLALPNNWIYHDIPQLHKLIILNHDLPFLNGHEIRCGKFPMFGQETSSSPACPEKLATRSADFAAIRDASNGTLQGDPSRSVA